MRDFGERDEIFHLRRALADAFIRGDMDEWARCCVALRRRIKRPAPSEERAVDAGQS